jgi:hypothetical protein
MVAQNCSESWAEVLRLWKSDAHPARKRYLAQKDNRAEKQAYDLCGVE